MVARYIACIIIVRATSKGPLGAILYTVDIIPYHDVRYSNV